MAMRAADDERFWLFWPTLQLKTFNIMIPSSPELNSEQFPFFSHLKRTSGSRDIIWSRRQLCPPKAGGRRRNIWLFAFGSFRDCVFGIFPYLCVCVCLCICLCVCISVFFLYLSFLLFLIIFFCSPSLPADDDYHEFEPSGSKLNRSILKWTRRARPVFGHISRISWLYFCISA